MKKPNIVIFKPYIIKDLMIMEYLSIAALQHYSITALQHCSIIALQHYK